MENYAIVAIEKQFGYTRGNLPGLNAVREVHKTGF
jgi:hypothetical protein